MVVGVFGAPNTPKTIMLGNICNKRCCMRFTRLVDSPRQHSARLLNELAAKSGALFGHIRKWRGLSIPGRLRHAREKEPDEKDRGHIPRIGCAE